MSAPSSDRQPLRILDQGDAALLFEYAGLDDVLAHFRALDESRVHGVVDLVPAARTLLVRFDPDRVTAERIRLWARATVPLAIDTDADSEIVVEVRYDGPDLEEVATLTGLHVDDVVAAHTGRTWTVAFGGFAPGFAYLVDGDERLRVPRRASPRTAVPAGAVGLAGEFSGIYPRRSPGGWQLIGTADVDLWVPDRDPPALLRPGARIRFTAR